VRRDCSMTECNWTWTGVDMHGVVCMRAVVGVGPSSAPSQSKMNALTPLMKSAFSASGNFFTAEHPPPTRHRRSVSECVSNERAPARDERSAPRLASGD
jgi:hypothetical protein